jgi:hypothetical protein
MMVFIGYEESSKCYRVYDPSADKLQASRDIVFEESRPWSWEEASVAAEPHASFTVTYTLEDGTLELDSGAGAVRASVVRPTTPVLGTPATSSSSTTPIRPTSSPPSLNNNEAESSSASETPAGIRWATPLADDDTLDDDGAPIRYRRLSCIYGDTEDKAVMEASQQCLLTAEEPRTVDEAIGDEAWRNAMDEEMASIKENATWELSTLPHNHKAIGLKWVYKVKRDADGKVIKHKARLIAKGYAQRQVLISRTCSLRWLGWRLCVCFWPLQLTPNGRYTTWTSSRPS